MFWSTTPVANYECNIQSMFHLCSAATCLFHCGTPTRLKCDCSPTCGQGNGKVNATRQNLTSHKAASSSIEGWISNDFVQVGDKHVEGGKNSLTNPYVTRAADSEKL
jgi:hypothetical protein